MADERLRVLETAADVLVANLRGEIGEVLTTWLLLRHFMAAASKLQSADPAKDLLNKDLAFLWLLKEKLENELIARLSELADKKIGRTNFYFAARKLKKFDDQAVAFSRFITANKLRQKRNQEIAHREQPEQWFEDRPIHIPYRTLVKATAMALRLMKRIDRSVLGPAAPFLWRQARKKRYELSGPPRAMYMLVPYFHLSGDERIRIVEEEQREGKIIWSEMNTTVDGKPAKLLACKGWGLILLGDRCLALDQYPLQKLESINRSGPGNLNTLISGGSATVESPTGRGNGADDDQTNETDALRGVQSQSGAGRDGRRQDAGRTGPAV